MSDGFAKLEPPKEMPAKIVQRIKDLKCPAPIRPTQASAQINALNSEMQKQASAIELLEKQVADLEKRYKISFTCNNTPKYDLKGDETPRIDMTGNLTNLVLDFHLWSSKKGIEGIHGDQGEQGDRGQNAYQGPGGVSGYYGVRGDMK